MNAKLNFIFQLIFIFLRDNSLSCYKPSHLSHQNTQISTPFHIRFPFDISYQGQKLMITARLSSLSLAIDQFIAQVQTQNSLF